MESEAPGGLPLDRLLQVFVCPNCKGRLVAAEDGRAACDQCRVSYPFEGGVLSLLRSEARPLPPA